MPSSACSRRRFLAASALASSLGWWSRRALAQLPDVARPRATDGDEHYEPDWDEQFTLSVGQSGADIVGKDDKALQAAVDYVARMGGGTIRIHDSSTQSKVFGLLGIDAETAKNRFGFLLDALQMGAPPHGGIALGIDRVVMLFGQLDNIREVIAFPKTQKAADMMTEAPNLVDTKQLRELGVKVATSEGK